MSLVDIVPSRDSLRGSRNSVQALLESRYCIPSIRFNRADGVIRGAVEVVVTCLEEYVTLEKSGFGSDPSGPNGILKI